MARIEAAVPDLAAACALTGRFANMVRNGEHDDLEEWLSEAGGSLLASLARGMNADKHAVLAATSITVVGISAMQRRARTDTEGAFREFAFDRDPLLSSAKQHIDAGRPRLSQRTHLVLELQSRCAKVVGER